MEPPVILVNLPYCFLNYDHPVRHLERKLVLAEAMRQRCKAARRITYNPNVIAQREGSDDR